MEKCPHCGATVSNSVDAFCPECRNAFDEPPLQIDQQPNSPTQQKRLQNRQKNAIWIVLGVITSISGVGFLVAGELAGLIGLMGGLILLAEGVRRANNQK